MLKAAEYLAVISSIVFAACLVVLIFYYASPPPAAQAPSQQHSEENKRVQNQRETEKPFWQKATTDPIAAFTLFLVIFTAVLSGVGAIQLRLLGRAETVAERSANAAKQAADVADSTLKISQRAWLGIDHIRPDPLIPTVGSPFVVTVALKNTGNTPARKVRSTAIVEPVNQGASPNFDYAKEKLAEAGVVAPGAIHQLSIAATNDRNTHQPIPLPQTGFDALKSEAISLYVHGRIDYEDIFSVPHWLTFCAKLIVPFDGHFGFCPDHNDTDDYRPQ